MAATTKAAKGQSTTKATAKPRTSKSAPAVTRKAAARKTSTAARRPAPSPQQDGTLVLRLVGVALVALSLLLAVPMLRTGGPVQHSLGAATGLLVISILLVGAALVARPRDVATRASAGAAAGLTLLAFGSVMILGWTGAGGQVGDVAWNGLYSGIGLLALILSLLALLGGLVLLGIPPRAMLLAAFRSIRLVFAGASWLLVSGVGFVIWAERALRRSHPAPAPVTATKPASLPPRKAESKKESRPDIPEHSARPVIRTVVEELAAHRPTADWSLPPLDILEASPHVEVSEADALESARIIEDTLATFGVDAKVREINPGPTVTQFALEPGRGTKVARITSLQNDLALALAANSIRMEAPVPGQSRVGLEIPNGSGMTVRLRDVMDSAAFYNHKGKLKLALGRDVTGRSVVGDLTKMPHLLIAGATGAGKSVCLNSIIAGFLFQHTPDELRFLMVDPKMVELKRFDGVPHLLWPVVIDVQKVVGLLKYAVTEMERRYKDFSELGIRNLEGYNRKMVAQGQPKLPHMVVIIDELADLMMAAPEEVEASICRLAQMARAVGIHLILATQRPSVDVLTGLIKANFPSRIAFAVSSQIDSRVILDMPGAERLLGRGDMLFLGPDSPKPMRVQGAFVSDEETDAVVEHWKQLRPAEYDPEVGRMLEAEESKSTNPSEDPLYSQALELAQSHARLSTSLLQRKLRIGYNRAARLMDALKDNGELDVDLED